MRGNGWTNMEKSEKVSVILPAYNVGEYIAECLDSISRQTYQNIEIIIVDDGSKDNTYELAEKYAKKDSRITVVKQKNAGSGPARNKGLQIASGEYVMFVDPDDWIDSNMIRDFMEIVKKHNPDMITSGYIEEYNNGKTVTPREIHLPDMKLCTQEEVREKYVDLYLSEAVCAPTRILYKKSIIDENVIEFPDLRRSQDIVFNYRYYDNVKTLVASSKAYYHYRIVSNSYLQKYKQDYYKTLELLYTEIESYLHKWKVTLTDETKIRFLNRFFVLIGYYLESCVVQKFNYKEIFTSECLNKIAEEALPIDLYHKILRESYIKRNFTLINFLIGVKVFIKKYLKRLFECFRKVKKY